MDGQSQSQSQRVMMIHDASGGVRLKGVKWVLDGFLLKDGDMITLLFVVHQILHPMGYKIRVDSSMFGGANQRAIDEEVAKKKKEYDDNLQLAEISKLYQTRKVDFKIEVIAGPIPKSAAVDASKKYKATWVILDRRMKRDKKFFIDRLSCGISTMNSNDEIIDIRGPRRKPQTLIPYAKMLPDDNKISTTTTTETPNDQELFSIEFDPSCASSTSTRTSISDGVSANNQDDKMSTLVEVSVDEQDNSLNDQVPMPEEKSTEEETIGQSQHTYDEEVNEKFTEEEMIGQNQTTYDEEVNENFTEEEIFGQSQHTYDAEVNEKYTYDEEVNYQFGGMSPMPKQAKHFYQGIQI
ncbi:putative 3-dehydroquinate synthase [Helianthus annuus]|uniref:uncharacterized protein LOC110906051 n=1 Tax=Helianthus annuus TaxID=4232 RepID=UPI000B8F4A49|nr:uncharacterized protein LOC110906051 [Helianthus annuus]KAJ0465069.1 putative 3-dehydroquinate synthase [Helianthus annuus]KAJ0486661.1 putative 3-dehydroquinate synthase [Helianthus annuus]KAJ0660795.1 putative 3-dehydroquinate synthase [Helianthus annuus]